MSIKQITCEDFNPLHINYLLVYQNGISSHFHALLNVTHQVKKAEYFRATVRIWNPANHLSKSLLSTSAIFFSEQYNNLYKFNDLPKDEFKKISIKIFHDWYCYKLRQQSKRYKKHIQYKLKDFTNSYEHSTIIKMEEIMDNKSIYNLVSEYIEYHATERERFIYRTMIGLDDIVYDDLYKYVLNYPGKVVTRQTFHSHKRNLIHKFKGLTLRASPPQPVRLAANA